MIDISEFVKTLEGKPVLIYGMGVTGTSLLKALQKAKAKIVIGDDNPEALAELSGKENVGVLKSFDEDFSRYAFLLLSPGVPLTHPRPHAVVLAAQKAGIEIIGDIELFHRAAPKCRTIGVTGTNGKSTTVTLIHHILKECGIKTDVGGNLGKPIFDLNIKSASCTAVIEMSSFQIDLCPTFRPDIAVILNLASDHIDRHGTMEGYIAVKERLCGPPPEIRDHKTLVITTDDEFCKKIHARAVEKAERDVVCVSVSAEDLSGTIYVKDGVLCDYTGQTVLEVGDLSCVRALRGVHNYQNAACAYAVALACGLSPAKIFAAMESFPGLQHRQFLVRTMNGVAYLNDSKATNAAATAMALGCHSNIYWIVGGRKKKNGLEGLEQYFDRIKHAFLIGESMEDFADWFDKYGMHYTRSATLENAVAQAHDMAQENRGQPGGAGVVMLSPACASFDQFKSFEDRGNVFTGLVEALEETV